MKKITSLTALLFLLFMGAGLKAQSTTSYHKMWEQLPEDSVNHTEVAYAVKACPSGDFILLNVFNEVGDQKDVALQLNVSDASQSTILHFAKRTFQPGEMLIGECGQSGPAVIAVPAGFDPKTLQISVTYQ